MMYTVLYFEKKNIWNLSILQNYMNLHTEAMEKVQFFEIKKIHFWKIKENIPFVLFFVE
jgi:hypothetical protein